jgi:hypothetical protein
MTVDPGRRVSVHSGATVARLTDVHVDGAAVPHRRAVFRR